jgi:CRISPR-associated protein Cas4
MIPVSSLSAYLYCPRKIFLEKVLRLAEPPKEMVAKGKIKHNVYDLINKSEEPIVASITEDSTEQDIYRSFENNYSGILKKTIIKNKSLLRMLDIEPPLIYAKIMPQLRHVARLRTSNIMDFIVRFKVYGQELWDKLTPKIKSEFKIESQSLGLSGIIDQVQVYDDILVPVELKSGSPPKDGVWPGHQIQVAAYVMMIEDVFRIELKKGYVSYIEEGINREVVMNPFLRDRVLELRDKVKRIISELKLPDKVKNENKCRNCGLFESCHDPDLLDQKLSKLF